MGTDESEASVNGGLGDFRIPLWRRAAGDAAPAEAEWTLALVKAVRRLRLPFAVARDHLAFLSEADRDAVLALANRRYEKAQTRARKLRQPGAA